MTYQGRQLDESLGLDWHDFGQGNTMHQSGDGWPWIF